MTHYNLLAARGGFASIQALVEQNQLLNTTQLGKHIHLHTQVANKL